MHMNMLGSDNMNFQGIQALGIMSALKTGDPKIDTMIAMLLPFVLTRVLQILNSFRRGGFPWNIWFWKKKEKKKEYTRTIAYRTTQNAQGGSVNCDEDTYNSFLIRSIKLYLHHYCQRELQDADLELTDVNSMIVNDDEDANVSPAARRRMAMLAAQGRKGQGSTSTASMLRDCTIIASQVKEQWHPAGEFSDHMVHIWTKDSTTTGAPAGNENNENSGKTAAGSPKGQNGGSNTGNRSIEIRLKSNGAKSIDQFVSTAYNWYLNELKKVEKNDRFLFDFRSIDTRNNRHPTFAKFKLGDDKTFDSLFSQQCQSLLKTIDQFETKTGKFAISGYPYKLGLLLHGPPGTGKTSLIKAMAHYTQRHIVTIPLSRIATNNDLTTLFFSGTYAVDGTSKVANLGFQNVIFVLEDVDAGSKVVKSRELIKKEKEAQNKAFEEAAAFQSRSAFSNTAVHGGQPQPPPATSGAVPQDPNAGAQLHTRAPPTPMGGVSMLPPRSAMVGPLSGFNTMRLEDGDELNLTGLLNVLDGVVDTPGRIVIMTTNHPEMLDPALIRPGRIDKCMKLGYMLAVDVIAMLEHYYQTKLSDKDKERVETAVGKEEEDEGNGEEETTTLKLIPARVEQLTMEKDSVEEMIQWLEGEAARAGNNKGGNPAAESSSDYCSSTDEESLESSNHRHPASNGNGLGTPNSSANNMEGRTLNPETIDTA